MPLLAFQSQTVTSSPQDQGLSGLLSCGCGLHCPQHAYSRTLPLSITGFSIFILCAHITLLTPSQEGGGGADMIGEMAQPLLSAMQDMGLPVPQMNQPPSSQSSANEVGQPPSEPPPLPSREEVSGRSSSSSLASLSR